MEVTAGESLGQTLQNLATFMREQQPALPGMAYASLFEYVVENGRPFKARALPSRWKYRTPRACYWNTYEIVRRSKGRLRYVEGFGTTRVLPIPFLHAWAIDPDDQVIDVTWREPAAYFGVVFEIEAVTQAYLERDRKVVAMIDDWERDWPLMRSPDEGG